MVSPDGSCYYAGPHYESYSLGQMRNPRIRLAEREGQRSGTRERQQWGAWVRGKSSGKRLTRSAIIHYDPFDYHPAL